MMATCPQFKSEGRDGRQGRGGKGSERKGREGKEMEWEKRRSEARRGRE